MGWAFFYMFVVLKIPIIALLYIVWWAVRDEPVVPPAGGEEREHRRRDPRHPRPPRPRQPRRGPHADPPPVPPQRTRAIGKRVQRTHGSHG